MASKKTAHARKRANEKANKKNSFNPLILTSIIIVVIVVAVVVGFTLFSGNDDNTNNGNNNPPVTNGNPVAIINTSMGTIKVELYEDKAPNTVQNFVNYAESGFYNGLVFHRVIDNFVIQGGGFEPDGTYKQPIYDPIDLEINSDLKHVDGAIAMARTSSPNSATSQFFIDDGAQPSLEPGGVDPNGYAVFGKVINGMNVVRAIAAVPTTTKNGMQDWPVENVIINSVTIEE